MSCGDTSLNPARNIYWSHFPFFLTAIKGCMIVVISEGKTVSLVLHRLQSFLDWLQAVDMCGATAWCHPEGSAWHPQQNIKKERCLGEWTARWSEMFAHSRLGAEGMCVCVRWKCDGETVSDDGKWRGLAHSHSIVYRDNSKSHDSIYSCHDDIF